VSAAAFACGLTAFLGDYFLLDSRATHPVAHAVLLFINIGAAGAVYFGLTVLLRVPESMELAGFIRRKFGRAGSGRSGR
jgi:hypothetical protein